MSLVVTALEYEKLGWFVLPTDPVKKQPVIKWAHRKDQRPSPDEIRGWFQERPDARIGVATGFLSGVDVVDIDGPQARERFESLYGLPETIMQSTGRIEGGVHLFFKYNGNGLKSASGKGKNKGIDLKTDGGFVIVAPSPHKSGKHYQWLNINPIEDGLDDLLEMPADIIEHFKKQNGGNQERKPISLDPVERGARNDTLTRLVGKLISQGLDRQTVLLTAYGWYHSLPDKTDFEPEEVERTVESIYRTHERNHPEEKILESSELSLDFPAQAMQGAAGYFANVYGEVMEAPQSFLFMSYLACLGSILSPYLSIPSVLNTEPRLYVLLVGRSNVERKSTTMKTAVKLFRDCVYGFKYHHGVGSDMGLAKLLNKPDDFEENSVGTLLLLDEFKSFVNKCKIQAQILLQCVNTLFENNEFENATKNKHVLIEDAHLSILAATTLQTYERIYDREFIDIGFPNRVFIVPDMAQRKFPIPKQISTEDQNALKEHIKQITVHVGQKFELNVSEEANEYYTKWYYTLPDSIYADRMETYSLRLAMLLSVNALKSEIDFEAMKHATDLCNWQIRVRKEHDPIAAEDRTSEMEERIRRVLRKGPKSESSIKQAINPWKSDNKPISLWVFSNAFKNLQNAKEIKYNGTQKVWFLANHEQNY
jgi:hypothetical protein